jgi:hypothetical protein
MSDPVRWKNSKREILLTLTSMEALVLTQLVADEMYVLPHPFPGSGRFRKAKMEAVQSFLDKIWTQGGFLEDSASIEKAIVRAREGMKP